MSDWLLTLRLVDLAVISFSAGLTMGLWWVVEHASKGVPRDLRRSRAAYLLAYLFLTSAAMVEIEIAISNDTGFSYRTVIVTSAAVMTAFASIFAFIHRKGLIHGMVIWAKGMDSNETR